MGDLDIEIKVAVQNALAELNRAEQAANKAEKAFDGFAATFARIAAHEARMAAETARVRGVVDTLAGSFGKLAQAIRVEQLNAAGKAFAGLAEQMKREADMLERIHGPMRQLQEDTKTLEMLQRKGLITAHEYAQEMARIRPPSSSNNFSAASAMPSLGPVGGALGAFAGVGAAKAVLDLGDSYIGLENRLRQVATSQEDLNHLMEATRSIADNTRSDWGATAESFVRLTNATKQLGISQERALQLQETLNMALQSSGASSAEASAGTLQLMQALSAGALQGDEFRSISESLPQLMDIFAKQLGVTRGELKKMGAEGKITTDIVVKGLESASGSIRDQFMASTATAGQQWTVFKNQLTESAGEFVKTSKIIPLIGTALQAVASALGPIASVFGTAAGAVTWLGEKAADLAGVVGVDLKLGLGTMAGMIVGGPVGAALGTLAESFIRSADVVDQMREKLEDHERVLALVEARAKGLAITSAAELAGSFTKVAESLAQVHEKMSDTTWLAVASGSFIQLNGIVQATAQSLEGINAILDRVNGKNTQRVLEINAIMQAFAAGKLTVQQMNEQLEVTEKKFAGVAKAARTAAAGDGFEFLGDAIKRYGDWMDATHEAAEAAKLAREEVERLGLALALKPTEGEEDIVKKLEQARKDVQGLADDFKKAGEAAQKLTKEQEAFAEAFKTIGTSLGDQLVDAANDAGQSWKQWGLDTLDMIEKMLMKMAILSAFTGSIDGSKGANGRYGGILGALGFAHGGTYIGGVGAVYGGAWANGGTWYAPQTGGGQDTIPVLSMVSPGERIDYTPSGQQPHGQAQSAAPAVVQVVNQPVDDRALLQAFSTASGRQVFHNLVRRDRSTIKALLD